ncbi:hypothetical protein [Paracoccus ravus]|uniref:hypothetical protein n=1 Tax=Paracoccus ravus TaxID=2447760 RepID=UPI00106EE1DF|nr:hypothetical protein [Paracoccus ravus]
MNVLVNTASVQLGALRYDCHATSLEIELTLLPGIGTLRMSLPPQVEVSARPGDEAVLKLNNGEGAELVLTGTVRRVARGPRRTELVAADAGAVLAAARMAQSFQNLPPGEVLRKIAGDLGLTALSMLTALDPMPVYVADQRRTAGEHVARLAELGGGYAAVEAGGRISAQPWPFLPPTKALLQGREVIDYAAWDYGAEADLAFVGASPASAGADLRALAQATEPVAGGAGDPAPDLHWLQRPMLRSGLGVSGAAEGARAARASRRSRMRATCWLLPGLRPGDVIEVQGLAEGISGGPWMLVRVQHSLRRDQGGTTRIAAVSARGTGLLDALSGLAGALP